MRFKFLWIGVLVVFFSVGSYAEDYLRFNLKSIELLENTWGKGNAKLKLFILVDNLDEGQSQLDISHKEFLSLGVNEELKLSGKAGISRLIRNGSPVNIYILAINEEENSVLARLAIASIGRVSGSEAVKFYKGFGKTGFFKGLSRVIPFANLKDLIDFGVGESVEYSIKKLMEHLEDNKIGTVKLHIDPMTMPSNEYVKGKKESGEGTLKISYDMEFIEENKSGIVGSSTQSTTNSKWITPKDSVCRANGGKIDKHGVCKAPWKNAKQICSASGGRLPTKEELSKVVTDCGGEMETDSFAEWARNKNNSQYQNCYKKRGFASNDYWSSTNRSSNAWIVNFYYGYQGNDGKDYNGYVRCVRAGE